MSNFAAAYTPKSLYGTMVQPLRLDFSDSTPTVPSQPTQFAGQSYGVMSSYPQLARVPLPTPPAPQATSEMTATALPRNPNEEVAATVELWKRKLAHESHAMAKIESELMKAATEEGLLKSRLQEISNQHRGLDTQLLNIQQGWSDLYHREQEDSAELQTCDRMKALIEETSKVDARVSIVRHRRNEAAQKHQLVMSQLASLASVEEQTKKFEQTISDMEAMLSELDERRRRALTRCSQMFDVECSREKEARAALHRIQRDYANEFPSENGSSSLAMSSRDSPSDATDMLFDPAANRSVLLSVRSNVSKKRRVELANMSNNFDSIGGKSVVLPVR